MSLLNKIISVIIPAYNEEKRIVNTLLAVKGISQIQNILVMDDGSKDHTFLKASSVQGIEVVRKEVNEGKGKALYEGIERVIEDADIIVFADADLEESAKDIEKLIIPIIEDVADVTIAKFPSAKKKGGFGLVKKLAKTGVYINTGRQLDTVLSGQRAFKKEVIQHINHGYTGYGVELGMTIDILNNGYRIQEVEVNMHHNETGRDLSGFIHRGRQFFQILRVLIKKTIVTTLKKR